MSEFRVNLPNMCAVGDDVISSGQPSRCKLEAVKQAGARTVINLRPIGEFSDYDEAAAAAELGLRYVHIPVAGAADLTRENAVALDQALSNEQDRPAIVHCASGNRVGALFALRERHVAGDLPETALQRGLDAGLNPESSLFAATRDALA